MALKPKIIKFKITLSDINRDYYDTINLTIAQHPSETSERMMARVLAFCLNGQEYLTFTKGLSAVDEPDIWAKTLDGNIAMWIDVGEPASDRIKKATRKATRVSVYCFNSKADIWWKKNREKFNALQVSIFQFNFESVQALVKLIESSTDLSVTITEDTIFVSNDSGECELICAPLQVI